MIRGVGRRWVCWLSSAILMLAMLCVGLTACTSSNATASSIALTGSATATVDPLSRIHNATQDFIPLFARITLTPTATFDEAAAILRGHLYPWLCDDPSTPIPPAAAEQRASFAASHTVLITYPT